MLKGTASQRPEETRAVKFVSVIRDETLFGGTADIESPRNLRVIPDG
jgi:hypothetical protein